MISKRTLGKSLVVLIILACSAAAAPVSAEGRAVRVGVYENRPKIFIDVDGQARGLFPDLLEAVAKAEGWTLIHTACAWPDCLSELERGRLDLMPDVAFSSERARLYDFHRVPVAQSWSQIYARPGNSFDALSDLDGKSVAVLRDSIQHRSLERMAAGLGLDVRLVPTLSLEEAFGLVEGGSCDAAVANHFFGDYFHRAHGLVKTPVVLESADLFFAAPKGRNGDLLRSIDSRLEIWKREPDSPYYQSLARWMDHPPTNFMPAHIRWLLGIALCLLVVLGCAALLLRVQVRARTRGLAAANEELRAIQAALRENEALLNATQRLSRIGGWEWDVRRQRAKWTEETYRIHGLDPRAFSPDTPEGREWSLERYDFDGRTRLIEAFRRCVEHGEPYDLECSFTDAKGRRMWVRTVAEAIRDENGEVTRITGNLMDVTERKLEADANAQLEEQLRVSQKMEAIGQLAGGVAHDFNNLITIIVNYADFTKTTIDRPEVVCKNLDQILAAAERAATLTRQLLAFSRKQVLEPTILDLSRVVEDLAPMLQRLLGEDVDLRVRTAPDLGRVRADRGQIEQVVMNLAVNARDAMPRGGRLSIETANLEPGDARAEHVAQSSDQAFVMLVMTDDGIGMDEGTKGRIFEPFFTTKEKGKGTGLGLATVYGIVSQSGGRISVCSEPGRGSSFEIYLPRVDTPLLAPHRESALPKATGSESILVVEDEDPVRDIAKVILERAGYFVLTAANGADAIEASAAHQGTLHLLLSDIVMPKMGGLELATILTRQRPGLKVLYMSGYADAAVSNVAAPNAGARLLMKPFTATEMTAKVRKVLDDD